MKAAFIRQPGPPDSILYGDLPDPVPSGRSVLVRVEAVSVNPIDTYLRSGMIPMPLPLPYILGCDVAGTVEEVGPEAVRLRKGDRVWGSNQGLLGRQGTFADYAAIDEDWLYPLPDSVAPESAAALALVGITAHLGLVQRAALRPGETLFVSGGSGGVGSAVIQMARNLGARVMATAGSEEKRDICRRLGAEKAVDYRSPDLEREIREFAPDGIQVWWDTVREPDFDLAIGCLAPKGRMVLMAGREARPPFPVGPFYVKGCSLLGFVMFMESADAQRACAGQMNRWMAEGTLTPRIGRRFPLREAAAAHQLQEENTLGKAGTLAGKIVLFPEDAA